MKDLTVTQRVEISEQLAARILDDAGFKDELLRDPRSVLASAFGLEMPDGIAVKVVADDRDVKHVILPFDAETLDPPDEVPEWYADLLDRARNDELFRHTLLTSPKTVLNDTLQLDLPERYDIRVLAETSEQRYVLLPYIEDCYDSELHDDTLELVVGGKSSSSTPPCGEKGFGKFVESERHPRHRRHHRHVCR